LASSCRGSAEVQKSIEWNVNNRPALLRPKVYSIAQRLQLPSERLQMQEKRRCEMGLIILIVVLLLIFGGGGGYYGYRRWGYGGGGGIGLGTILVILLVLYLLGFFR
jgi:hypothetical protein